LFHRSAQAVSPSFPHFPSFFRLDFLDRRLLSAFFPHLVPGLPSAPVPGLPSAPVPGLPSAPVPGLPSAPVPGLPSAPVPGLPSAPGPGLLSSPVPVPLSALVPVLLSSLVPGLFSPFSALFSPFRPLPPSFKPISGLRTRISPQRLPAPGPPLRGLPAPPSASAQGLERGESCKASRQRVKCFGFSRIAGIFRRPTRRSSGPCGRRAGEAGDAAPRPGRPPAAARPPRGLQPEKQSPVT
jgi:hypothetical protein